MVIFSALIGFMLLLLTVKLCNKINNRIIRYAAMLFGIVISFWISGQVAGSTTAAQDAGMYIGGLALFYTLFFERNK